MLPLQLQQTPCLCHKSTYASSWGTLVYSKPKVVGVMARPHITRESF